MTQRGSFKINMDRLHNLIWLYNYYRAQAQKCREWYNDPVDFYTMYDYNMQMAQIYEEGILSEL